jgi:hypothetical protein
VNLFSRTEIYFFKDNKYRTESSNDEKFSLLRRYMNLLKTTVFAFFLSTSIHIGLVTLYYYVHLWRNPDDEGKKRFYSQSVSNGVNIGGKIVGAGGVSSNSHKSYLFHLVREFYKNQSVYFFVQFSAIYLLILFLLKFFPEREKLKQDTLIAFNIKNTESKESDSDTETKEKAKDKRKNLKSKKSTTSKSSSRAKSSTLVKRRKEKIRVLNDEENIDDHDYEEMDNDDEVLNEEERRDDVKDDDKKSV